MSDAMERADTTLGAAGLLSKRLTSRRDAWSGLADRSEIPLSER